MRILLLAVGLWLSAFNVFGQGVAVRAYTNTATIFVDSLRGNDSNSGLMVGLPKLTIGAAIIAANTNGYIIDVGSGTYNLTNTLYCPTNGGIIGHSATLNWWAQNLTSGMTIMPADNSIITGLNFKNKAGSSVFNGFIGTYNQGGFTNANIYGNTFDGNSDIIFTENDVLTVTNQMNFFGNTAFSDWDTIRVKVKGRSSLNVFNNFFYIRGGSPINTSTHTAHGALIDVYGTNYFTGNVFVIQNETNVAGIEMSINSGGYCFVKGNTFILRAVGGTSSQVKTYNGDSNTVFSASSADIDYYQSSASDPTFYLPFAWTPQTFFGTNILYATTNSFYVMTDGDAGVSRGDNAWFTFGSDGGFTVGSATLAGAKGNLRVEGALIIRGSGGISLVTNSTAPVNTSIIRSWYIITNSTGGVFKAPLYQ